MTVNGSEPRVGKTGPAFDELARAMAAGINEGMSVQITIRGVPEAVRDELAARAAAQGRSMEEFLRVSLERLAARPTVRAWVGRVQQRKRATGTRVRAEQILKQRDAGRR
ncbi:MAG: FitA-like ribbon-helix-helix domain-containing protein [Terriglobales bacterium]